MKIKLNDHGWGMKEMIIAMLILLFFLLVAIYYINQLFFSFHVDAKFNYLSLENKLEASATKYVMNYNIDTENITIITSKELKQSRYLSDFVDEDNNDCEGYIIFEGNNYDTYIKCPKYTTNGYNSSYTN